MWSQGSMNNYTADTQLHNGIFCLDLPFIVLWWLAAFFNMVTNTYFHRGIYSSGLKVEDNWWCLFKLKYDCVRSENCYCRWVCSRQNRPQLIKRKFSSVLISSNCVTAIFNKSLLEQQIALWSRLLAFAWYLLSCIMLLTFGCIFSRNVSGLHSVTSCFVIDLIHVCQMLKSEIKSV